MASVMWANQNLLRSGEVQSVCTDNDRVMVGLSCFLDGFIVDSSGALPWSFNCAQTGTAGVGDIATSLTESMQSRASALASLYGQMAVITRGSLESLGVITALLQAGVAVTAVRAGGLSGGLSGLLTSQCSTMDTLPPGVGYCDDGAWRDLSADYLDRHLITMVNVPGTPGALAQAATALAFDADVTTVEAVKQALLQMDGANTAWGLLVAMHRTLRTQCSVLERAVQNQTVPKTLNRLAFYDDTAFDGFARLSINRGETAPRAAREDLAAYVDTYWGAGAADLCSNPTGQLFAHRSRVDWIDEQFNMRTANEFPLEGASAMYSPATWEQIEYWRDAHEISPIQTALGWFHADPHSVENRMKGAIQQFSHLPMLNADGTLTWKQPGQVRVPLTQAELQQAYDEIKLNAAVRSSILHFRAEQFNAMDPRPTPAQLQSLDFWVNI